MSRITATFLCLRLSPSFGVTLRSSNYVATIIDYRQNDRKGALIVGGCGMDMGFHVVYSLARSLYPEKPGQRDGGYSLKHEWL